MPIYRYKAVTKNGQIVQNRVEEINKFILLKKLKKNNLLPISVSTIRGVKKNNIKKQKRNIETTNSVLKTIEQRRIERNVKSNDSDFKKKLKEKLFSNTKITQKDIVIFTQNLYLLKKANFNNIHALYTIIETTENPSLKAIIEDILLGVEAGENMYTTMEYYSGVFNPIYINMIRVGELSGSLTQALEQAVKYLDETMTMNKKIKDILVPNLLMFFGLLALLIVSTVVLVPIIQNVFAQVGSSEQLPGITIAFSNFLNVLTKIWYIPVTVIIAIIAVIWLYIRTPEGKFRYDNFKYKMPVFGSLIYAIDFSRLMKAVLLNIKNGMRIQEALETSKTISRNVVMLSTIEASINNILIGQSWIDPFEKSGFASPMVIEMLKIGMQTDLPEMMEKLLEYMDTDINNILQRIIKVLPQIVYVIVGIMLIFVTIVVLVPLIQVYMGSWLFSAYL